MRDYRVTAVKEHGIVHIKLVFSNGAIQEVAMFMLPIDKQWHLDMEFIYGILDLYKKRLNKTI